MAKRLIKLNLDSFTPEQLERFWRETFKPNRFKRAEIRLGTEVKQYRCDLTACGLASPTAVSIALGRYAMFRMYGMFTRAEDIYKKLPTCCQWRSRVFVQELVQDGAKFRKRPPRRRAV